MQDQRKGIGSHQSAANKTDVWITPKFILEALGIFDLDPCSHIDHPWPIGKNQYYLPQDGLALPWIGRVWLNSPYTTQGCENWLGKMAKHNHGTALSFARTETKWFHAHVWNKATGILFLEGRLYFHYIDGSRAPANAGAPSCLISYGLEDLEILARSQLKGKLVVL